MLPGAPGGHPVAMFETHPATLVISGIFEFALGVFLIATPFIFDFGVGVAAGLCIVVGLAVLLHLILWTVSRTPRTGVSALARGTSRDIEAGDHTVLDD
jgi:hypothetical protein